MGAEPPFIYDHPSKYSILGPVERGFNPKAISQLDLSLPTPRSRPDGPLINFKEVNRHPDSYYVAPYGNLNWKPMSPHTKSRVKCLRITQLALRICELILAVGLLVCVICVKGIDATTGWILRVPPGIAMLHTVYGIYHLSRSANGRTPSSSAGYCIFAATIDAGLIPFVIFTALISHTQSVEPVNAPGHWSTLFGGDDATTTTVFATFITSVVNGTFQVVSLAISVCLGIIFRKISRLPPDMNPLEDNLTSRHKRNKSSFLDSRLSHISASIDKLQESKAEDPLMVSPTVPFMHTRNDSYSNSTRVSHPSASVTAPRSDLPTPFYDQPPAHRSPFTEMRGHIYDPPLSQRSSQTDFRSQTNDQPRSFHKNSHSNARNDSHPHTGDEVSRSDFATPSCDQALAHHVHGPCRGQHSPSHQSSRTVFPVLSPGKSEPKQPNRATFVRSPTKSSSIHSSITSSTNQSNQATMTRSPTRSSSIYSTNTMTTTATSRPTSTRPRSTAPSLPDDNWITYPSPSPSPSSSPPRELKHLLNKTSYQPLCQTSPFEYTMNNENIRPLEMNPPTPPLNKEKAKVDAGVEQRVLTPGTGNLGQGGAWSPGALGIGKAKAWGGMGRSGLSGMGSGGRVVSRSGVEVKDGGIYPSGGIRAREVSGKVMEEGRLGAGGWT